MGVYIRGMEMPKSCWDCEFEAPTIDHHECCILTKKSYNWGLTTRPSDCPLVSVPPHGRLIDADTLAQAANEFPFGYRGMILAEIAVAPTIIEAEEESDGNT